MKYITVTNFAKLLLLIFALSIAVLLTGCNQSRTPPMSRSDSVIFIKSNVQQNQNQNDSLQAKKDSIPQHYTDNQRDVFWAKYLY